jgi:hypothetical protein
MNLPHTRLIHPVLDPNTIHEDEKGGSPKDQEARGHGTKDVGELKLHVGLGRHRRHIRSRPEVRCLLLPYMDYMFTHLWGHGDPGVDP